MTMQVLFSIKRFRASNTNSSDAASSPEVGSSRIKMGVLRMMARAMAIRWRWPPDSVTPRSPTMVLYSAGKRSINSWALAS